MKEWIQTNHFELDKSAHCYDHQLGFRDECIRELVLPVAENDGVILIPTNFAFLKVADNLACGLKRLGITNIVYWALDQDAHDFLLSRKLLAFFVPVQQGSAKKLSRGDPMFNQMLRNKPIVFFV